MVFLSLCFGAYLLGSIPFGLIIAKFGHIDLRQVGSGNIGATNVYRAMGLKAAVAVFVLDALKGTFPTYLATLMFGHSWQHIFVGCMALIGHSFPIFAHFKGGKGAATGLGILAGLAFPVFLIMAILAGSLIGIFRMVSVGTLVAAMALPFLLYGMHYPAAYVTIASLASGLVIVRHRTNISRLIQGKENKI